MPFSSQTRSPWAGIFLGLSLLVCLGMAGVVKQAKRLNPDPATTGSAEHWLQEAENLQRKDQKTSAIEACRAGLVVAPWHPELCRTLTLLLLAEASNEDLRLWMDDLVMGDARQAEQLFQLPGFTDKMDDPDLQRIHREAIIQARD